MRCEAATGDANEEGQILVSRGRNEAVHLYKALIVKTISYFSQDVFLARIQVQRTALSRAAGE